MNTPPSERWQQIEAVLGAALEVPTGQRRELLDRLCADEPDLRREVESLLAAHAGANDFLSSSAGSFAAPYLAELPEHAIAGDTAGMLIGRYRLIEEIGRGGMGTVWLAERADGQFEQRVALKLIKRGMDSADILSRFLRERQILARLEHPNIARLLDGGVSEDGRPYFVMEYVRGIPLTRSCDERQLGVDARLRLFVTVCRAVQYAHRNLVVHRDIKPSNVLVTESGDVTLLDFGVAKLLSEDQPGDSTLTAFAVMGPMTPEYASPEQLGGQPVTTASDVYQLGVLLFELLAGRRPFQFTGRDRGEIERVVREEQPSRPSTKAPDAVRRRLRGDLDAIVLRALSKAPEERQPSAEALAEDVERHLSYLPLRYGSAGWWTGVSKYLQRHRLKLAAAVLLVATSASFGWLYVSRIRAERDRAQREVTKNSEMTAALRRVFRNWNPDAADAGKVSAETMLGDAVMRARQELAAEPDVLAATLSMLGDMYLSVGQREKAESVLSEALAMQQRLPASATNDLAATLARRGYLLQELGRLEEAESSLRSALDLYRGMQAEGRQEAAEAEQALALVLRQRHKLVEAETLYREILRRTSASDKRQEALRSEVTTELGYVLFNQARYSEAVELLRSSLEQQRRNLGRVHRSTLRTTRSLASALRGPDHLAEAEALDREALDIARALYGDRGRETNSTRLALAIVLERRGDFAAAESFAADTVLNAGRNYQMPEERPLNWRTVGSLRLARGNRAGAEAALRTSLGGLREALPEGHPDEGDVLNRLAFILLSRRATDADSIYTQAVAFERRRSADGPFFMTDGYEYLAWSAHRKGDNALAERLYRRALALYEKELPTGHPYRAQTAVGLGETLLGTGRRAEAERYLREGLTEWRASRSPAPDRIAEAQKLLAAATADFRRR